MRTEAKMNYLSVERIFHPSDFSQASEVAFARALGADEARFTLVHVGAAGDMLAVHEPRQKGWTWDRTVRRGDVVEQILEVGIAWPADLIVLTTERHHGFLDALRGSTSERVVRGAQCPVLAIPSA
jgi:nucleotide-binding universal stress UspA family protein